MGNEHKRKGDNMDWSVIGTGIALAGFMYGIIRNLKTDLQKNYDRSELRIDALEERIFLLATGKTLKEAMLESKKNAKT
jgi:hypothetical protein